VSVQLRPPRTELRYAWLGDVYVDLTANQLHDNGREVRLTPKAMAVLGELMLRQNVVVRRDDLLGLVWHDGFPTDDVLTHAIKELRRALNDDPRAPLLIETIPRVGYRLRASVRVVPAPENVRIAPPDVTAANEIGNGPMALEMADSVPVPVPVPTPGSDEVEIRAAAQSSTGAMRRQSGSRPIRSVVFGLMSLAVATLAWNAFRSSQLPAAEPSAPEPRSTAPMALTSEPGGEYFPAISPDGSMIAYVAAMGGEGQAALMLKGRDPAARAVTLVPKRTGIFLAHPAWSPDGARILFAEVGEEGCTVRVVPVSGGTLKSIASCRKGLVDAFDWAPEGHEIYSSLPLDGGTGARGIAAIALDSGATRLLDYHPRAQGDVDLYPRVSPDGRWIVFRRGARPYSDLWLMPRSGGEARVLVALGSRVRGMAWSGDGASVIVSSDHGGTQALYRVAIEDGEPTPLGIELAEFPSAARRGGYLAYHQESDHSQIVAFDLDAAGVPGPGRIVAPASRSDHAVALSPSGRSVAFVSERSGSPQVWVHDFETQQSTVLSNDAGATLEAPQWAPDENTLLYVRRAGDGSRLVRVDIASGRSAPITPADERVGFGSYTPDGAWILYSSNRSGAWQVWRMRADGSGVQQLSRDGGLDPRSFAGDPHVYYNKLLVDGLFRLDPGTGREVRVTALSSYIGLGSYAVAGNELWLYRKAKENAEAQIVARPLGGGLAADAQLRVVARIALPDSNPSPALASFDRARRRVVTTMNTRDGTDVFVVSLTR
jgi:Tol biopolymer transport system component/DNA-binding winged helix-turn-helix (wHTH) protein